MVQIPLEKLLDKSCNSIYKLVLLAAKRAQEIAGGQPVLIERAESKANPAAIALLEIADGKVQVKKIK